MGLDCWFPDGVRRILASVQEAQSATANAVGMAHPELTAAYQQGHADALRAVGVAFGVTVPEKRTAQQEYISAELRQR